MTNTEPAAPATGCGGMPGHPMKLSTIYVSGVYGGEYFCPGCLDCQPAPTPSEDAARAAFSEKMWGLGPTDEVEAEAISEFAAAIRAESAEALRDAQFTIRTQMEALQEARDQLSAANRELSALSSDKQTLMTATTHWRDGFLAEEARHLSAVARAETAEARLREVEGALTEVRKWVQYSAWHTASCPKKQDETVTCECGWAAIVAERLAAMAAATPSTDEEGR